MVDVVLLHVAHQAQRKGRREDARVLGLVFLQDVRLHRATHRLQGLRLDPRVGRCVHECVPTTADGREAEAVVPLGQIAAVGPVFEGQRLALLGEVPLDLLVDGGVEEEGEDDGRGAVDRHADARVAVAQVEARVEPLCVVHGRDGDARVADLAPHVRPLGRVTAVQGDGVESGGEADVRRAA